MILSHLFCFSEAYLNLPGQLVDCGELCCTTCSIYLDIIHETVWSAGPGSAHTSELISAGVLMCSEILHRSNIS